MLTKQSYLFGTTILAGLMALSTPALAQSSSSQSNQNDQEATQVGEVVITGSRIRNRTYSSPSPITTITQETSEARGIPDVAQAVLTSPSAAGSFQWNDQLTGYVTAGGGGTQSVALRGAGAQRTLTLINGRRAGPAGTRGQVQAFDLGTFPSSLVERMEILNDGASSIYGSDAVAGVLNIITRNDWDGGRMGAFYSQPFESGGEQYRIDGAFGRAWDGGYANFGVEYSETKAQRRGDRDYTSCASDYLRDPATGARIDHVDPATGEYKCYNLNTNYVQVAFPTALGGTMNLVRESLNGSVYTYGNAATGNNSPVAGWARWGRNGYPATWLYAPYQNADNLWQDSTVISPSKRLSVSLNAGVDLSDNVELYGEFLFNRRKSEQNGVAQIFQNFAQVNILYGQPNNLPASNPNNPFGYSLLSVIPYRSSSYQEIDYLRGVIGLRGTMGNWDWDIYGQMTRSDATYSFGPRLYLDRFVALNSAGTACTNTPLGGNVSGFNCSALPGGIPWTDARVLAGNFTDAERTFLFFEEEGTTVYDHMYVEGVISTNQLFSLPAGDVGAAFGFQVRKEEIDDTPGFEASRRNQALLSSAGPTRGSDTIKEVFAEFQLPLLANMRWADDVSLNISGRYSDYESYGETTTYKAGLNWAFSPEVRFRTSYGTSFRAPALYEQFLGAQVGYGSQASNDPCYDYTNNGAIDPNIRAGCVADNASTTTGGSSVAISSVGGRGLLNPETADSWTIGMVFTPTYMPISVAFDYYEFEIKDAVSQLGAYEIISRCYRGDTGYCSLFQRIRTPGPDQGKLGSVNNAYVNVSSQENRGVDLQIQWSEEYDFGRLTLTSGHNLKVQDTVTALGSTSDYLGRTFNYNGPAYSGNFYATLQRNNWTYFYGIDMIGRGSDIEPNGGEVFANARYANLLTGISSSDCNAPNNYCALYELETPFYMTHSASVAYRTDSGWTARVGIQNIWDEAPPMAGTGLFRLGNAALNGYDMRGRRASLSISKTF